MDEPQGHGTPGDPAKESTTSGWRVVGAHGTAPHPPLPPHVKWGGLGLLALLVAAAVLIGVALGGGFDRSGEHPGPTASPELIMDPPIQVGEYVRGRVSSADPQASAGSDRQVSADYSDGVASIVFLMVWPRDDLRGFMEDAGVEIGAEPTPSSSATPGVEPTVTGVRDAGIVCGVSADTDGIACAKVVRDTGLMVAALSGQQEEEIAFLLEEFEQAVTP